MIDVKCRTDEGLSLASNLHLIVSVTQLFVSLDLPHLSPAGYAATFPCEFANDSSIFGHTNKHRVTTGETGSGRQHVSIGSPNGLLRYGLNWTGTRDIGLLYIMLNPHTATYIRT